ncbi:hypothetical protein LTR74_017101 [Friedmanniomyces endolithicus]|nr:hypothetical protein LTR74_017101 [Friedmanniomyces endolithicus]
MPNDTSDRLEVLHREIRLGDAMRIEGGARFGGGPIGAPRLGQVVGAAWSTISGASGTWYRTAAVWLKGNGGDARDDASGGVSSLMGAGRPRLVDRILVVGEETISSGIALLNAMADADPDVEIEHQRKFAYLQPLSIQHCLSTRLLPAISVKASSRQIGREGWNVVNKEPLGKGVSIKSCKGCIVPVLKYGDEM